MKKNFILSLIANVSRVGLGFVFFWQVSQSLGLEKLGEYLYLIAALGYFGTLIDYGFNLFVLNAASRSDDAARPLFLRVIFSKIVLTFAAIAILLAIYGFAFVQQGVLVTALFFVGLLLQSFSGLLIQFFKALGRFDHEFNSTLLASALPVALLFAFGGQVTLVQLGWMVVFVRVGVLFFQLILFLRQTKGQPWATVEDTMSWFLPRALKDIRGNFKYAVFSVLGATFLSVDLIIMRFTLGLEAVSIYGTAMKVILAAILFFEVLTGVFIPSLARQHTQDKTLFWAGVRRFAYVMFGGALVVSVGLILFGPGAINWAFGVQFAEAGSVLRVLSVVLILRVMTMVSGSLLTIYGLQGFRARVMIFVLPLHIGINWLLQPQFGIWGAVYTLGFSFLLLFILNFAYLLRAVRLGR